MRGPYGTRWADIDEPAEVVEAEDRAFFAALGVWSVQNAMRPPEPDEDVVPDTFRANVLELYAAEAALMDTLRSTWRGRLLLRLAALSIRLRGRRRH